MTRQPRPIILKLLDKLEEFYGKQEPGWPVDPYEFLVWWYCGYPASDAACAKGWEKLHSEVGIQPKMLLRATPRMLSSALRPGGMFPDLRGLQLKEIALRMQDEFGGDLRTGLHGPLSQARKTLKTFPGIADAGADRILLFAGIAPIAAVPSNCTQVVDRLMRGQESKNYATSYREAQKAIAAEVPETFDARTRAYLLLKRHGQELCKRTKPKCESCPVSPNCAFFRIRMYQTLKLPVQETRRS
jgi:endonuclease III